MPEKIKAAISGLSPEESIEAVRAIEAKLVADFQHVAIRALKERGLYFEDLRSREKIQRRRDSLRTRAIAMDEAAVVIMALPLSSDPENNNL